MAEEQNLKEATATSKLPKIKPVYLIIGVLVLITIFSLFKLYQAQQELNNFKENPEEVTSREIEEIIEKVGKLIDLPQGETPTIATVTDPEKLKDQAFFSSAREGDKVLIYNNARRAILYRPSSNKVIDTAPINIGDTQPISNQEEQASETTFIILNGTTIAGLAGRYQQTVEEQIEGANIVSVGNAEANNIEETFIVDSSGKNSSRINSIASTLGIEIGTLPSNQLDPEADFIIVVGADSSGN